jgi:hypothetical protein
MNGEKRQELAQLFRDAKQAHQQAYIEVDGADPDWPIWYAGHLQSDLNRSLNIGITKSELVYLLVTLDRMLQREAPGADWADYYARVLLERYGWGEVVK